MNEKIYDHTVTRAGMILRRGIAVAAGIGAAVLFAELVLAFFPSCAFESMVSKTWEIGDAAHPHRYRVSEELGYELVPLAEPGVNSFGMRDREYALAKPAGTIRLLLVGDSLCEWERWSDRAEELLNRDGRYEILNAGTAGWGLPQYSRYLSMKADRFSQDAVLVGYCLNDDDSRVSPVVLVDGENTASAYSIAQSPFDSVPLSPWLFRHSALYRVITVQVARYTARPAPPMETAAALFAGMRRASGGRLHVLVFPYVKPLDSYTEIERNAYRRILTVLRSLEIPYIDLTPVLNRYDEKEILSFRLNPSEQVHANDALDRIYAGVVARWIKEEIVPAIEHPTPGTEDPYADHHRHP